MRDRHAGVLLVLVGLLLLGIAVSHPKPAPVIGALLEVDGAPNARDAAP